MRAFMSDRELRADLDWFDAQPTPTVGLGQFCQDLHPGAGFQAEDIWHAASLREACAILAAIKPDPPAWPETDVTDWDSTQPVWNLAPWQKRGACYRDAAESLAAFLEREF